MIAKNGCALVGFFLLSACIDTSAPTPFADVKTGVGGDSDVVTIFHDAARETGVPASLIAAIAYAETRFRHHAAPRVDHVDHDGHVGEPRSGMFGLTQTEIDRAAAGSNELRDHAVALAQILASHAPAPPTTLAAWIDAVAAWRGQPFADTVAAHLARGLRGIDADGVPITVTARAGLEAAALPTLTPFADRAGYPLAIWNPAHSSNYSADSRGAANINYLVVHTIQGSYGSAINWFKNPDANVSAHYVVKSADGEVTQMVDDSDRAWHDACFNSETIGIEHEGYVSDPELWYTESMVLSSARLAAHIARTYGIPIDRSHVFGHGDAPDCSTHTDPGPGWDWDHYMALVRADGEASFDASLAASEWPTVMTAGEEATVWLEFDNLSNITWGLDETRLGTAEPRDRASEFFVEDNWLSANRATGADHSDYGPGATGRFTFIIRAPEVTAPTTFNESFQLVQEGVAWFGPTASMSVRVIPRGWTGDPNADPDGEEAAGCSTAQSGGPFGGACAILFACALLAVPRRRRLRAH